MPNNQTSREAATDNQQMMAAAHAAAEICRPFRAGGNGALVSWGSRPRLRVCRAFGARSSRPNPRGKHQKQLGFLSDRSRNTAQGKVLGSLEVS